MIRALLVEDDLLLAQQFIRILEKDGVAVVYARHAGEAIAAVDEELFDVIILDILLPATSGFALLHELQSYSDTAQVPVIMCTSMASDMRLDELHSYGVRRLIDKVTMEPSDMGAAIRAVIG